MDGRTRRGSYHTTTSHTPMHLGPDAGQAITQYNQDRRSTSIFSPMRHEFERYSISQHYDSGYGNHHYQGEHLEPQQIATSSPMQGIATQYPNYMQSAARNHPHYNSAESQPSSTYTSSSMLPPMQQTALFESIANYAPRATTVMGPMGPTLQVPSYLPTNNQNAVCIAAAPTHYITSPSDQLGYNSALCRPDDIPSFSATTHDHLDQLNTKSQPGDEQDQSPADANTDLQTHEDQLKIAFELLIAGSMNQAATILILASSSLLSSVVRLNLHVDVPDEHNDRLPLWREFNHCWEALAQRQKDILLMEIDTGHKTLDKLTSERIKSLVDELIALCDRIDHYGLVDYERGVWEDQIIGAFESCLDLMDQVETSTVEASRGPRGKT